jgi:hypothetical protein
MSAKEILEERGWLLLPSVVQEDHCARLLETLEGVWVQQGRPATYARGDAQLTPSVTVSPVGMAVFDLLARLPEAREWLLRPVEAVAKEALGGAFRLENVAGVLSDHTRPFFFWHHHLEGLLDAREYLALEERYPIPGRLRRLSCTLYPVPLDDEHGVMLLHPRRIDAPTHPPGEDMDAPWPGQHVLRCPPGSILVMDECVWHAVTPMTRPGRRGFLAGFLVAQ